MEERLIEFVKENEFLYNKWNRNYKKIDLRDRKFEELSSKLNVPAKKLKERWRTLKDKFYREIKRENVRYGRGTPSPRKKWKWMEQLMFLKEMNATKNATSRTLPKIAIDESTVLDSINVSLPSSTAFEEVSSAPAGTILSDTALFDSFSDNETEAKRVKVKPNKSDDDLMVDAKQQMSDIITLAKKAIARPQASKSAAQLFFECLAKQTDDAHLSPEKFVRLQMEMVEAFSKIVYET